MRQKQQQLNKLRMFSHDLMLFFAVVDSMIDSDSDKKGASSSCTIFESSTKINTWYPDFERLDDDEQAMEASIPKHYLCVVVVRQCCPKHCQHGARTGPHTRFEAEIFGDTRRNRVVNRSRVYACFACEYSAQFLSAGITVHISFPGSWECPGACKY